MACVEEELWNIFTFYTLHGNPFDLTTLSVTHFLRLAKDCQITHGEMATPVRSSARTNRGGARPSASGHRSTTKTRGLRQLGQATVNLAFTCVIQRRVVQPPPSSIDDFRDLTKRGDEPRHGSSIPPNDSPSAAAKSKLTYPEFLEALMVLGERLYGKRDMPSSSGGSRGAVASVKRGRKTVGDAHRSCNAEYTFQKLLMENVLPLASRRRPFAIENVMNEPLVLNILEHFGPALREMFRFYAASSSSTGKTLRVDKSKTTARRVVEFSQANVLEGTGSTCHVRNVSCITIDPKQGDTQEHSQGVFPTTNSEAMPTENEDETAAIETKPESTIKAPAALDTEMSLALDCTTTHGINGAISGAHAPSSVDAASVTGVIAGATAGGCSADVYDTGGTSPGAADNPVSVETSVGPPDPSFCMPSPLSSSSFRGQRESRDSRENGINNPTGNSDHGRNEDLHEQGEGRRDHLFGHPTRGTSRPRRRPRPADVKGTRRREINSSSVDNTCIMNSMADTIPHCSLLEFASDFGISGALISTLEVGEVYLSCGGDADCNINRLSGCSAGEIGDTGHAWMQSAWRTEMAREGTGGVRPLSYRGLQEALVRIALECFGPRKGGKATSSWVLGNGVEMKSGAPGLCLRALLTYMWRRLHASAELALNGVRAGGARHRSSMQKGALLKGVQLFNERMLSRWRAEGFLDLAWTNPTLLAPSCNLPASTTPAPLPRPPPPPPRQKIPPEKAGRNATNSSHPQGCSGDRPHEKVESASALLRRLLANSCGEQRHFCDSINSTGTTCKKGERADDGIRDESNARENGPADQVRPAEGGGGGGGGGGEDVFLLSARPVDGLIPCLRGNGDL